MVPVPLPIRYCDPLSHELLQAVDSGWRNPATGRLYPVQDGIVHFLVPQQVIGLNLKYQNLYDRIAWLYDASFRLFQVLRPSVANELRASLFQEIEIRENASVLEVSIGTGLNLPAFPASVDYYGLDLSLGMLRRCQRNLRKWRRSARLAWGEAEHLPYPADAFDIVFHVGGINFFSDPALSIREMIRVARPGTRIVIADETEEVVEKQYARTPFLRRFFRNRPNKVTPPRELVPSAMIDLCYRELHRGNVYCLSFRKP